MIVGHIGGGGEAGSYKIAKSLRFRASASAYLSRTLGINSTSQTKMTWSGWVKRGTIGAAGRQVLFYLGSAGGYGSMMLTEIYNDTIRFSLDSGLTYGFTTAQVFRDPSAWYNLVFVIDTTLATSSDRIQLYVNGLRVTAFVASPSYPPQNYAINNVSATVQQFGNASGYVFDGYTAEQYFIDGQALTPSSFGQTDPVTGQWTPKKYSGTYGANGFYLPFNVGTSLTTLCEDRSGNTNNWTATNVSLTAGTTYDWMDDTPTNSFATFNPLISLAGGFATLYASANLSANIAGGANGWVGHAVSSINLPTSGKWYAEFTVDYFGGFGAGADAIRVGVTPSTAIENPVGAGSGWAISTNGSRYIFGAVTGSYISTSNVNDVMCVAYDASSGKLWFGVNGVFVGSPAAGTGEAASGVIGDLRLACSYYRSNVSTVGASANFGQRPFAYTPPTGFKALCTKNLPTPTGAAAEPKKHFDAVLRNGFGVSGGSVSSLAFPPDFLWEKSRNAANSHNLWDSVRGVNNSLFSNLTNAEFAYTNFLTSFNSNGFSFGSSDWGTGVTIVDWLWKAGGAAVTNNAGSITSQVSANPAAGFSIVTYTAPASGGITVGHGLGVAPKFVVVKARGASGNWTAWHGSFASSRDLIELNLTSAKTTGGSSVWNDQFPSSTVFGSTVGSTSVANQTHVAYCFAEIEGFSRIGSYTGNGSTDGPFVWCGFRPRYVLIKMTSSAGYSWEIFDTARDTYNASGLRLFAESSSVEVDSRPQIDFLSNGFKLRATSAGINANTSTFLYMAFAEAPFKYANAR